MRLYLVALVPAIGLCLSKSIENPIEPQQYGGSQDDPESICITYVTTYLAALEPRGGAKTGKKNIGVSFDEVTMMTYMMKRRIAERTA